MSDWQAITHDPCLNYSPYHHSELLTNIDPNSFSPPPTCWNRTKQVDIFHHMSNADVINGQLVFDYNLLVNGIDLNCRLHIAPTCYPCKSPLNLSSHVDLHFKNTAGEICYYKPSPSDPESNFKLGIVCKGSNSTCLSLCLHIHQQDNNATIQDGQSFHNTYTCSLLLLQDNLYESAKNKCESETADKCHWIPDSLVTDKTCRNCQPICRGLSHTMTFIQFVIGSVWFMLTYPVAEVALPVVISDSTVKEYQVSLH